MNKSQKTESKEGTIEARSPSPGKAPSQTKRYDAEFKKAAVENWIKPRQHVAESAAATITLAERFKDADEVLSKCLDKLAYQFKDNAPDFFNEFQSARTVVDIRGGRKTNKTTPTPAPQPA